jgi:hypothetical protein
LSDEQGKKNKFKNKSSTEASRQDKEKEFLKSIDKDSKLQQQKQREIEQQNISPEEIMEEEEKRQPQSTQEE